jgi:LAO/AO transport system kinase
VNKADGENLRAATLACAGYRRALGFLQAATPGWKTRCVTCSAFAPETLAALWDMVIAFAATTRESGAFEERRRNQSVEWMRTMIAEELGRRFFRDEKVRRLLPDLEREVGAQTLPAAAAVRRLMERWG